MEPVRRAEERLNILMSAGVPKRREGGVAAIVYNLGRELENLGHRVTYVFLDDLVAPDAVSARFCELIFSYRLARYVVKNRDKFSLVNLHAPAGLHRMTGGDGRDACAVDMLLQSLVACAGVTLRVVATAMGIAVRGGSVRAEGVLDFRGTMGVSKETPVGFREVRLHLEPDCDATPEQRAKLLQLTERYCVVYQTLKSPPPITTTISGLDVK